MLGVTMIVYVDYVLLAVLLFLTFFTCGYCVYRVYNLQQNGQIEVLLKPTKVLFAHKKEGIGTEELRTVVAYQNPLTGSYCVRKARPGADPALDTGDTHYEPLADHTHHHMMGSTNSLQAESSCGDNSLNKTWNWNYKEYQI